MSLSSAATANVVIVVWLFAFLSFSISLAGGSRFLFDIAHYNTACVLTRLLGSV